MLNYVANTDSLTLHIRLTKKCNADCSYCSSYEKNAKDLMSLMDLDKSLNFLINLIHNEGLGGTRKMLTVQYVGGEISTISPDYIKNFTDKVREKLSPLFIDFKHGVQTNLIASEKRILNLIDIFESNIGTSVDNTTNQRTVNGSSDGYQKIFFKRYGYAKKMLGKNLPAILVVDKKMSETIYKEIEIANQKNMNLMLRPVFQGGMPINSLTENELKDIFVNIFNDWFLKSNIIIDPIFSLLQKRLESKFNNEKNLSSISGCPFQHNCATSSINLEPDGTLYICLDMADSKNYPLGNAINEVFDNELFNKIKNRSNKLNTDCISCDYFRECQGGCMNEAIEHNGDIFSKTRFCIIWKALFKRIDEEINKNGITEIQKWIEKIER